MVFSATDSFYHCSHIHHVGWDQHPNTTMHTAERSPAASSLSLSIYSRNITLHTLSKSKIRNLLPDFVFESSTSSSILFSSFLDIAVHIQILSRFETHCNVISHDTRMLLKWRQVHMCPAIYIRGALILVLIDDTRQSSAD